MSSQAYEHPLHLHQMMMRLGIDPDTDVFPRSALQYAMASRGCGACRSKRTCQDWLDHAPAKVNFAPWFCRNADILFELQCDQAGPRRLS